MYVAPEFRELSRSVFRYDGLLGKNRFKKKVDIHNVYVYMHIDDLIFSWFQASYSASTSGFPAFDRHLLPALGARDGWPVDLARALAAAWHAGRAARGIG